MYVDIILENELEITNQSYFLYAILSLPDITA